uniref:SH3 domain-containing protein n=1 Tax=Panthera tigris altaica TaxID=74533 RepID=A0A8C9J4V6_PANTA
MACPLLHPRQIVDTSGGPQFASGVRRPHLTSEAVALLRDNLTPRENALWTSLGDAWTQLKALVELRFISSCVPRRPQLLRAWTAGPGWQPHANSLLPRAGRLAASLSPTCVVLHSHQDPEPEAEPQLEPEGKWVLCNYDFQARNSSELSVQQRDVLEVLDDQRKWWKVRDQRGQEGYVPYNILTPHPGPRASRSLNSTPPPPRAPAPASSRPTWDSCDSLNLDPLEKEKFSQMLCVNEELQATVDALGVLTGAQLFSLQKEELRAVSPEEGARVYSQVTVQRALLEDKEKVSELEAVMEKQKKKVEGDMETEII